MHLTQDIVWTFCNSFSDHMSYQYLIILRAWWILTVIYSFTQFWILSRKSGLPYLCNCVASFSLFLHNVFSKWFICITSPKIQPNVISRVCTKFVKATLGYTRKFVSLKVLNLRSLYWDTGLVSGRACTWNIWKQVLQLFNRYFLMRYPAIYAATFFFGM